jgi:hypothetical protein
MCFIVDRSELVFIQMTCGRCIGLVEMWIRNLKLTRNLAMTFQSRETVARAIRAA